jgi:hypothetical protein
MSTSASRSDNGEIDRLAIGDVDKRVQVGNVRPERTREARNARVPWHAQDVAGVAVGGKPRDERVLTRAAADDENPHVGMNLRCEIALHGDAASSGLFR